MGFEDEVEQSMPRPLPLRNGSHHQPEAQHPKFSAIHKLAGLPHLKNLAMAMASTASGRNAS